MINQVVDFLSNKKIIILGFGREGKSSYNFIRKYLKNQKLTIADKNEIALEDENVVIITGENYLQNLNDFDIIIKTPGISFAMLNYFIEPDILFSQTEIFLRFFGAQTIGITGTKGKSTTTSLIYHILKENNRKAILAGNIGIPFFDILDKIDEETWVVAELSAHQLEFVQHSPHIALLLNLFQEHLDHFNSFHCYIQAKLNITKFQKENDYLVYNEEDVNIAQQLHQFQWKRDYIPFSNQQREGAVLVTTKLLGLSELEIEKARKTFVDLEHRREFVAEKHGILWYNDSIATAPEATIFGLRHLKNVDTLILGGFDRGIDYHILFEHLQKNRVSNVIFMGPAGKRMKTEWEENGKLPFKFIQENDMQKIIDFAILNTAKGKICFLSPAASSFDNYSNFEERGKLFKQKTLQPFSLKQYNSFNIDSSCENFICVNSEQDIDYLFENDAFCTSFLILGGGCNTLFVNNFNGIVIHINTKGIKVINSSKEFVDIEVQAGEDWEEFVNYCVSKNYYGIENLSGIPGKVGSAPVQNIGAYGVEVKDSILCVNTREIPTGSRIVFSNKECEFGYRDSIFKNNLKNKILITSVAFRLSKIEKYVLTYNALQQELQKFDKLSLQVIQKTILEIRNSKLPNPKEFGSAGSFFKNPFTTQQHFDELLLKFPNLTHHKIDSKNVKLSAAQLIELAGWKGYRLKDAGVYPLQPLVLVNYGSATGEEIAQLAHQIQISIKEMFGVDLEKEVGVVLEKLNPQHPPNNY